MNNQNYGIARVSTKDQNLNRQIDYLEKKDVPTKNIIQIKQSGKTSAKFFLDEIKKRKIPSGSKLFMDDMDRMSRDVMTALILLDELQKMGIDVITGDKKIDTTDPNTKLNITIMCAIAEWEREKISENKKRFRSRPSKRTIRWKTSSL
jgi:DNA invertase Pin-like site-specific DNA recombinase